MERQKTKGSALAQSGSISRDTYTETALKAIDGYLHIAG